MSIEAACISSLAPHLRAAGLECGEPTDALLHVPGLALELAATKGKVSRTSVFVTFDARPRGASDAGICVLSAGFGECLDLAVADAASQWALGVLPVLRSYLLHCHVCEVQTVPMVVGLPDSEERYGWTVHLGPVIGRAYGKPGSGEAGLGDLSQTSAYEPLFHVLHAYAAHRRLMWVESFASRYFAKKKVDATCRLNNRDIEDGREALLAWANTWPETGARILSKRQFLLLEPTPIDRLENSRDLTRRLDTEIGKTTKPWWKRIWGGT